MLSNAGWLFPTRCSLLIKFFHFGVNRFLNLAQSILGQRKLNLWVKRGGGRSSMGSERQKWMDKWSNLVVAFSHVSMSVSGSSEVGHEP